MQPICESLEFEESGHRYMLGDEVLPSVTQIIGHYSAREFEELKRRGILRPEHLEIGTLRHETTELYDRGQLDEDGLDPILVAALDAWKLFRADTGFSPELIEQRICSERVRYAGTIDRVGTLQGGRSILIDIKGEASVKSHGLQLGAYAYALEEQTGQRVDLAACVHLKKNGTYKVISIDRAGIDRLECDFVSLAMAYHVLDSDRYGLGG